MPTTHVKASLFEGLFEELKPTGAFLDDLRAAGWDRARPKFSYPDEIWIACLKVAARHAFPNLDPEVAQRELGRAWARGFAKTVAGRIALAVVPNLSPVLLVDYIPRIVSLTSATMQLRAETLGPNARLVRVATPGIQPLPDFTAGAIEQGMSKLRVEVAERLADGYSLRISWA